MMKFCDWGKNLLIFSKIHYLDVSDKQLSDNYLIMQLQPVTKVIICKTAETECYRYVDFIN